MPFSHLALLRGINVGGKNRLPMQDLTHIFSRAGCTDVRTYIQSGNVYFNASPNLIDGLNVTIVTQITEQFGYHIPVIVRSRAQLQDVIQHNPFLASGSIEDHLHVMFLADQPVPERISALDSQRSPSDDFIVQGQEVYLRLPNGMADTKLTNAYFDSKLATVSTCRNWRTVTKLLELLDA